MSTDRTGLLIVYLEGAASCSGRTDFSTTVSAAGDKFEIGAMPVSECSGQGAYKWKRSGTKLTLTIATDKCGARLGLFAGVWTKTKSG